MKKLSMLIILFGLFSCTDNEPENPTLEPVLSYILDNGETFSTNEVTMSYDSRQQVTFIKYTDSILKVRVNIRGRTAGVYSGSNGIFYVTTYNPDGSRLASPAICDTFTGIEVTVDEYGEVGEMIAGSFVADNCDVNIPPYKAAVTGSFRVLRTE